MPKLIYVKKSRGKRGPDAMNFGSPEDQIDILPCRFDSTSGEKVSIWIFIIQKTVNP